MPIHDSAAEVHVDFLGHAGLEHPVGIEPVGHRGEAAELAGFHCPAHSLDGGVEAVGMTAQQVDVVPFRGVDHLLALFNRERHWLL